MTRARAPVPLLERLFRLTEAGTTVRTEVRAGVATFLTMAYIVVVNPTILAEAGVPFEGALFATCVASAFACLAMAFLANYPFALAPGMGLNAYFAYSVVQGLGVPWQTALGAVFLSGTLFIVLTLGRVRALVVDAIPRSLKLAAAAGIGLFIAFIGLRNAGIVVASPGTLVTLGRLSAPGPLLALGGLILTGALLARGVAGALIWGIVGVAAAAFALGLAPPPRALFAVPDAGSTFLALDVHGALALGLLEVVFVFLFVDLFDSVGSFMGLAHQGGFLRPDGTLPRASRALLADALGTVVGALLGTSTVTTYIESAAGISQGGRTGLTAVVVALLLLAAAFAAPLAGAVPAVATAPALVLVGVLMARAAEQIPWADVTEAVPAFLALIAMPLTFSISNGLALGFIAYAALKLFTGRWREARPLAYLLALLFLLRYLYLAGG